MVALGHISLPRDAIESCVKHRIKPGPIRRSSRQGHLNQFIPFQALAESPVAADRAVVHVTGKSLAGNCGTAATRKVFLKEDGHEKLEIP